MAVLVLEGSFCLSWDPGTVTAQAQVLTSLASLPAVSWAWVWALDSWLTGELKSPGDAPGLGCTDPSRLILARIICHLKSSLRATGLGGQSGRTVHTARTGDPTARAHLLTEDGLGCSESRVRVKAEESVPPMGSAPSPSLRLFYRCSLMGLLPETRPTSPHFSPNTPLSHQESGHKIKYPDFIWLFILEDGGGHIWCVQRSLLMGVQRNQCGAGE